MIDKYSSDKSRRAKVCGVCGEVTMCLTEGSVVNGGREGGRKKKKM